jgi:hypothetical protein
MCVGPVKDMMTPKVIQNKPTPAPVAPLPPPIPITAPKLDTEPTFDLAIPKKPKRGNALRVDLASGSSGSSGLNTPF